MRLAMIAAIVGLSVASALPTLPSLSLLCIGVAATLLSFALFLRTYHQLCLAACGFIAGFVWSVFYGQQLLSQQMPHRYIGVDFLVQGVIGTVPEKNKFGQRFDFYVSDIKHLSGEPVADWQPEKIRLSVYFQHHQQWRPGQYWQLQVRLKPLRGLMNPGGFDYQGWLLQRQYRARGYLRDTKHNQVLTGQPVVSGFNTLRFWFEQKRFAVIQQTLQTLHDDDFARDDFARALFVALAVGEKQFLTAEHWRVLKQTGTMHLVVVSGLHISLIALIGYGFGSLFSRALYLPLWLLPATQWSALSAILFAAVYAGLSGFSLPTQRAVIMVCCLLMAVLSRRTGSVLSAFLTALLLVLLLDPLAVFSRSLYLSFGAVACLLLAFSARVSPMDKTAQAKTNAGHKIVVYLNQLGRAQWVVFIGLLPLLLVCTGESSLLMPLVNFIAVPLLSFVLLPLVLLTVLPLFYFPGSAEPLVDVYNWSANQFWQGLSLAADYAVSWHLSWGSLPRVWVVISAVLAALLLLLPKGLLPRLASCYLLLPLLVPLQEKLPLGEFRATVLDVGQGLSVIVETRNGVLVYDTGEHYSDKFDIGRDVVAPALRRKGYRAIDYVVVSHGDSDHVGGLPGLLAELPVGQLFSSRDVSLSSTDSSTDPSIGPSIDSSIDPSINPLLCYAGQRWQMDNVHFDVLSPQSESVIASTNNQSCVVKVSNGNFSLLLTGDIERSQEQLLLRQYRDRQLGGTDARSIEAEVLLVPHHGSKTSSSLAFIRAVNPRLAIASNGFANRYGHPHPEVVARYRQAGIPLLRTDQSGAVVIRSDRGVDNTWLARRHGNRRYWHD